MSHRNAASHLYKYYCIERRGLLLFVILYIIWWRFLSLRAHSYNISLAGIGIYMCIIECGFFFIRLSSLTRSHAKNVIDRYRFFSMTKIKKKNSSETWMRITSVTRSYSLTFEIKFHARVRRNRKVFSAFVRPREEYYISSLYIHEYPISRIQVAINLSANKYKRKRRDWAHEREIALSSRLYIYITCYYKCI